PAGELERGFGNWALAQGGRGGTIRGCGGEGNRFVRAQAGKICGRKGLSGDFLRSGAASGVPAGSGSNKWRKSRGQKGESNIRVGIFFAGGVVAPRSDGGGGSQVLRIGRQFL